MKMFLLGLYVALTPSVLTVAWLIWRADIFESTAHLEFGRNW